MNNVEAFPTAPDFPQPRELELTLRQVRSGLMGGPALHYISSRDQVYAAARDAIRAYVRVLPGSAMFEFLKLATDAASNTNSPEFDLIRAVKELIDADDPDDIRGMVDAVQEAAEAIATTYWEV